MGIWNLPEARKGSAMRRYFITLFTVTALVCVCATASAQVFYEYPGAPVVTENEPVIGTCLGIGDELFRIDGYARFNLSPTMDLGLELLFDNFDENWRYGAGGDVKYAIVPKDVTMPFDLSLNGGFGFESGNDITTLVFPVGGLISRPLELSSGRTLVPYGGVYLLLVHTSVGSFSNTESDVELRGGANFNVDDQADLFAALHLGAGTMFYIGINWHL